MTLASIPLMDRTGRRTLHLYGLGGMFIFSIFITISFLIKASRTLRLCKWFFFQSITTYGYVPMCPLMYRCVGKVTIHRPVSDLVHPHQKSLNKFSRINRFSRMAYPHIITSYTEIIISTFNK